MIYLPKNEIMRNKVDIFTLLFAGSISVLISNLVLSKSYDHLSEISQLLQRRTYILKYKKKRDLHFENDNSIDLVGKNSSRPSTS